MIERIFFIFDLRNAMMSPIKFVVRVYLFLSYSFNIHENSENDADLMFKSDLQNFGLILTECCVDKSISKI